MRELKVTSSERRNCQGGWYEFGDADAFSTAAREAFEEIGCNNKNWQCDVADRLRKFYCCYDHRLSIELSAKSVTWKGKISKKLHVSMRIILEDSDKLYHELIKKDIGSPIGQKNEATSDLYWAKLSDIQGSDSKKYLKFNFNETDIDAEKLCFKPHKLFETSFDNIGNMITSKDSYNKRSTQIVFIMIIHKEGEKGNILTVADASVYGFELSSVDPVVWEACSEGTRMICECRLILEIKGTKIKVEYVSLITFSKDYGQLIVGPPCAVVCHEDQILTLTNLNSTAYIDFKYKLKNVIQFGSRSSITMQGLISQFKKDSNMYRINELESISAFKFIHRHDIPLSRIKSANIQKFCEKEEVRFLRNIASDELSTRYMNGTPDTAPKIDLPSGKMDLIIDRSRCETAFKCATRELYEECGIPLDTLKFTGCTKIHTKSNFVPYGCVSRTFFFFEENNDPSSPPILIKQKDAYSASSWTHPTNIANNMRCADTKCNPRGGSYFSLRMFSEPNQIDSALRKSNATVEEVDFMDFKIIQNEWLKTQKYMNDSGEGTSIGISRGKGNHKIKDSASNNSNDNQFSSCINTKDNTFNHSDNNKRNCRNNLKKNGEQLSHHHHSNSSRNTGEASHDIEKNSNAGHNSEKVNSRTVDRW